MKAVLSFESRLASQHMGIEKPYLEIQRRWFHPDLSAVVFSWKDMRISGQAPSPKLKLPRMRPRSGILSRVIWETSHAECTVGTKRHFDTNPPGGRDRVSHSFRIDASVRLSF